MEGPVDRQELHIVGHLRSLDYHKAIYVAKVSLLLVDILTRIVIVAASGQIS